MSKSPPSLTTKRPTNQPYDMDTTATTHLSLCSGYGGIDLGLRRAIPDLRTIAYAEIEAFACENLLARMEGGQLDPAPIWPDLKSFPWGAFSGRVDILSGGYPCQPFSAAGKRLGKDDPRHLWPFIADGIRLLRPRMCFFENVEGHISLGLREVISELESMGYAVSWGIFSAREVGAPHQRKRVFILAHRKCEGLEGWQAQIGHAGGSCSVWPSRPGQPQHGWEPPRVVANARCGERVGGQIVEGAVCAGEGELGKAGEIMADPNATGRKNWSEQHRWECSPSSEGISSSGGRGDVSEAKLGDTEGGMSGQSSAGDWREGIRGASEAGQLGDSNSWRQSPSIDTRSSGETISGGESNIEQTECREAEPSLGGDANGTTRGMGYAELQDADNAMRGDNIGTVDGAMAYTICGRGQQTRCECGCSEVDENQRREEGKGNQQAVVSNDKSNDGGRAYSELCVTCDNRTDELRLLGNGVVPATATLAFQTLLDELLSQ